MDKNNPFLYAYLSSDVGQSFLYEQLVIQHFYMDGDIRKSKCKQPINIRAGVKEVNFSFARTVRFFISSTLSFRYDYLKGCFYVEENENI
ncbi:hypothetical protein [Metabacillus fastidiosus]|uniref:hypothetical protein n=1 Tax=Metabacillus fastidiosus TaxID=1458 RepID=UPI003D28B6C4